MLNKNVKITITVVAIASIIGCSTNSNQKSQVSVSEESLGLRKTTIYTEQKTVPITTNYTNLAPGTSKNYERAFTNAPPMIPHSVEGLIPIDKNNNQCVSCHMPAIAKAIGATPISKTHFINWRPKSEYKNGTFVTGADVLNNKTFSKDLKSSLYQGRYNCTQCHAPQSQGKLLVKNDFKPDFQSSGEKSKSNLIDTLNIGINLDN